MKTQPGRWARSLVLATALALIVSGTSAVSAFGVSAPAGWPPSFTAAQSAPEGRFAPASAVVGDKLYVFGGLKADFNVHDSYMSYDPGTDAWTPLGTLPAGMAQAHLGVAHDDRYVFFVGGFVGELQSPDPTQTVSGRAWRYDTQTNQWAPLAAMPQARGGGAVALVGNRLHYIGGIPSRGAAAVSDHFVYNVCTDSWEAPAAPPSDPKDHAGVAVMGTKIYVIGGHDSLDQQSATVHVYDATTNVWTPLADLPEPKSHTEASTYVTGGKIVVAGGQTNYYTDAPSTTVYSYDPVVAEWSNALVAPLPVALQGAVARQIGSKVVVALGARETTDPNALTWLGDVPGTATTPAPGSATEGCPPPPPPPPPTPVAPSEPRSDVPPAPQPKPAPPCEHSAITLRWAKSKARLQSVVIKINGKRYAKLGAKKTSFTVPADKLSGNVKISIEGRAKGGKRKLYKASRSYTPCAKPAGTALKLRSAG